VCNDIRNTIPTRAIQEAFSELRIPLFAPEGLPNLEPRQDIRITDRTAVVRQGADGAELVVRRWSWPGPGGKPVYNFKSEGRRFSTGRCLIPCDAFYEFTAPGPAAPKRARKLKWSFRLIGEPWLCIAGLWRSYADGEAFTMLTTEPGPDVAPYHSRQVVVLRREHWAAWLSGEGREDELLAPLPGDSLEVEPAPS
jgi:putative SOS response-associated peptidase YedK